ncbi:MAG: hypothetical protein ACOZEN_06865 [Thermodesulfobacteriota bacterium]
MSIPTDNPKIVYGSTTLWLPTKFTSWKRTKSHSPSVSEGLTYIQVVSAPVRYEVEATTATFRNTSEDWDGGGAEAFLTAWASFWDAYGKTGKVFQFYRTATDSTAGVSYFQYSVWTGEGDGLELLTGNERYRLNLKFATEGAAR